MGVEFKYPADFKIEHVDNKIKISFPESYKNKSYTYKNDVYGAWLSVGVGAMKKEGFSSDFCQKSERLQSEEVKINNINFIKNNTADQTMGGYYTDYNIYGATFNGNCYEIALAIDGKGSGAGSNDGQGPLPGDYANPSDKDEFISILDQVVSTF